MGYRGMGYGGRGVGSGCRGKSTGVEGIGYRVLTHYVRGSARVCEGLLKMLPLTHKVRSRC